MTTHNMTLDELIDRAKQIQISARENRIKNVCGRIKSQLKHGFSPTLESYNHSDDLVTEALNRLNQESTKYELKAYTNFLNDPIIKIAIHEKS